MTEYTPNSKMQKKKECVCVRETERETERERRKSINLVETKEKQNQEHNHSSHFWSKCCNSSQKGIGYTTLHSLSFSTLDQCFPWTLASRVNANIVFNN